MYNIILHITIKKIIFNFLINMLRILVNIFLFFYQFQKNTKFKAKQHFTTFDILYN